MTLYQPISVTTATFSVTSSHAEAELVANRAAGITFTLPASEGKGAVFNFFVGTTFTGSGIIKVANSTDIMQGVVSIATDAAGVTCPTAADSDTITMNGSTTGGLKGSYIILTDVASGVWEVAGALVSTGAEATPFSATV